MQLELEYTLVELVLLRAPRVFGDKQIYLKLCKKRGHFYAMLANAILSTQVLRKTVELNAYFTGRRCLPILPIKL